MGSKKLHYTIPSDHKSGSKIGQKKLPNEKTESVMETLETWIA
jgi:hypothetical protein